MNRDNLSVQEKRIESILKEVIDPELMVNIIDLGLVYEIHCNVETKEIAVDLTLTSPGCPLGDAIMQDVEQRIMFAWPGYTIKINLVWSPPWSLSMISDEGRAKLDNR